MTNPSSPHVYGHHAAVPSNPVGGAVAGVQMMADGALAEQMALADWDEGEERGPQPEDEPLDAGHLVEKKFALLLLKAQFQLYRC